MKALIRNTFQQRQHMLLEDYEIYHYFDEQERYVSLHFHDFYECYFLLSGHVTYQVEHETFSMSPGDLLLLSPNQLHRPLIDDVRVPYERIVLWITKPFLKALSSASSDLLRCFHIEHNSVFRLPQSQRNAISKKLFSLLDGTLDENFAKDIICRARVAELLVELNRDCITATQHPGRPNVRSSTLVRSVSDYLDAHLTEPIHLESLACDIHLSKYHLSRTFRQEAGVTIFQMLRHKRMIRARNLIQHDISFSHAAEQCGFSDYSSFYKAFLLEYGVSPREYVRQMLNDR